MKIYTQYLILTLACLIFSGCGKIDDWLDVKRQKEQVSPETLKDFQAILDDFTTIHNVFYPFGLVGADDIYLTSEGFNASLEMIRNAYVWNRNIWDTERSQFWDNPYRIIFKSNVVIEGLDKGNINFTPQYNDIKGQSLFYRAISYFNLAQLFCKPFSNETAVTDLGLPLKLTSDVNILESRASVFDTYYQMLSDAKEAVKLLPVNLPDNRRPNKATGYALLARICLMMDEYEQARNYADSALQLYNVLLDFNSDYVSTSLTYRFPFEPFDHPEILFYAQGGGAPSVSPVTSTLGIVDSVLYSKYEELDLRRSIFFEIQNTLPKYRGAYSGKNANFAGIATNELYLIRSECNARLNEVALAISDLNTLLRHRYVTGEFTEYSTQDQEEALELILTERRKELIGVGNRRWEDLRRLNKDDRFKITLKRVINGETITLEPNSSRYVLPIPDNEIQLSDIEQNPR